MKGACYCELAIMKDNRTGGRRVVNGAQNGNTNYTEGAADDVAMRPVTMRDNMRLIAGFTVMVMGAFLFFSILSFFFYWKEDMSALAQIGVPMADPQFSNICGKGGARVASAIVGEGFGLFSIVIPIALLIWGWRVFRYKPLRLLRSVPICGLVLILGSLTLGFIFDYGMANCYELFVQFELRTPCRIHSSSYPNSSAINLARECAWFRDDSWIFRSANIHSFR